MEVCVIDPNKYIYKEYEQVRFFLTDIVFLFLVMHLFVFSICIPTILNRHCLLIL